MALTGRYSGVLTHYAEEPTHENQFRFFCHYVEKLKLKQVEEEYYKYEEASNPTAPSQAAQKSGQEGILPPSINKEIGGMAPPASVKEVMRGLLKGESDGLETPNSKNTIVIPVSQ